MAKIELKFLDAFYSSDHITVCVDHDTINIYLKEGDKTGIIYLDKSTAIKFAKTLRTEINKIED